MKIETIMKMDFSSTRLTAIVFLAISIVAQSFGDPVVLHHPSTNNDASKKLTCISEDDDSALVWNYNPNKPDLETGQNIFTSFEPKNPTSKNITKCALWNSTLCFAEWENIGDWNVVDSAMNPMGPVFDYRWEDFEEIVVDGFPHDHEYRYVKKFEKSSGTAIFSVRGLWDLNIFLCENKTPENGPCFWIIIGGWRGERSAIRTCVTGAPVHSQLNEDRNCIDVAIVTHGGVPVIDAYEWRTFRLEWNSDEKTIRIFNETEIEPFLDVTVDQWYPVSHLSIQSEIRFRIRFHFYKYFQTTKKNAVLSTTEFLPYDKKFCVELLVGLCPDCALNVILADSEGEDVTVKTISGLENSISKKLLNWRSVRLDTTLPNLKIKQLKLKISTNLNGDEVEGHWAIDTLHTCKTHGGSRQSTITTDRETSDSSASLWPTVKCQKLSYTANSVVDSLSGRSNAGPSSKPLFYVTPKNNGSTMNPSQGFETKDHDVNDNPSLVPDVVKKGGNKVVTVMLQPVFSDTEYNISGKIDELLLNRKVRSSATTNEPIDVYEGDRDRNTISIRLNGPHLEDSEIRSYTVSIAKNGREIMKKPFGGSVSELECKYWENALCFEKLPFSFNDGSGYVDIKVCRESEGVQVDCRSSPWSQDLSSGPSRPLNLMLTNEGHGIVTLKWLHPRFTYTKLTKFEIDIKNKGSKLKQILTDDSRTEDYFFTEERKEYEKQLYLFPSSNYTISVLAVNRGHSAGSMARSTIEVSSSIGFANEKLNVSLNGTLIKLVVPEVINATRTTFVDIIVQGMLTCYQNQSSPSASLSNHTSLEKEWRVAKYQVNDAGPMSFLIGANRVHDTALNCSLHPEGTYSIEVNVRDSDSNPSDTLRAKIPLLPISGKTSMKATNQNLVWLIIILILAACLAVFFIWYRKQRKAAMQKSQENILPMTSKEPSKFPWNLDQSTPPTEVKKNRLSIQQQAPEILPYNPHSYPVKIEEFEEYAKDALASGVLDSQYALFPRGLTKPCECATLPENMPKNRYKNLMAYDETRVVLQEIPGVPHSDYINANYIQGYRKGRAYIATQGPKPNTVNDFWRMVWQEKVGVICMLANVIENGKKKCEQYWPEVGTQVNFGDILITNKEHQIFADYTVRSLTLNCQTINRNVTHLHYTGWPDHGIPMYTQSLVSYLKKLKEISTGNGPVIIHCSAGVGRTGTIILCDICLRQADAEKVIDASSVTSIMREDRPNMVDTEQQYLLAHLTIVESIFAVQTEIPCNNVLREKIKELKKQLPSDIQRLNDTVWQDRALHSLAAPKRPTQDDVIKNENSVSLIPENPDVASSELSNENNSINAMSVDGVKMKNQYLASCLPSPTTLSKFWMLIAERRIELVVILQRPEPNDPRFSDLMPDESILIPVPHIQVETKTDTVEEEYFSVNKFLLTDTSQEEAREQPVTVLTCTGWRCRRDGKPPATTALVSLWRASEKIPRKESPSLVLCYDGITGCGLYLALSFLLERMAVERECDVISAVRAVRRSRPEFVQSLKQFEYLYDAAVDYIKCFETYANFA